MNVKPATTHPQATQEIDGMIEMIQTLIDKDYAYPVEDGTVYFRVKTLRNMASFLIKIWMICSPVSALFRFPARIRRKIQWTLFSGSRKRRRALLDFPMVRRTPRLAY